jgi:hypothetical protein
MPAEYNFKMSDLEFSKYKLKVDLVSHQISVLYVSDWVKTQSTCLAIEFLKLSL